MFRAFEVTSLFLLMIKTKRKKRKKESKKTDGVAKNKTGCGINDGYVRLVCVYAEQFCFLMGDGLWQPGNLLHFFYLRCAMLIFSLVLYTDHAGCRRFS